MTTIVGVRRDLGEDEYAMNMGEYGKVLDIEGVWMCCVPATGFSSGTLGNHQVTEHEDGTITVSPSIISYGQNGKQWHGYLERGVWREI